MKTIPSFLLAVAFAACSSPNANSDNTSAESSLNLSQVKQIIDTKNEQFANAMLKGDSATLVSLYHSDAKVYPPQMPATDRNNMGSMAVGFSKSGVKTFSLHATDVSGNADAVIETGTYEMGDGTKTTDKGKYIVIWKPENGDWKLWRDIWNSDNEPMAAAK